MQPHKPIVINGDLQFQHMAKEYRFKGDGTPHNPFVWQIKNAKSQIADIFDYVRIHDEEALLEVIKKEFCKFGW